MSETQPTDPGRSITNLLNHYTTHKLQIDMLIRAAGLDPETTTVREAVEVIRALVTAYEAQP